MERRRNRFLLGLHAQDGDAAAETYPFGLNDAAGARPRPSRSRLVRSLRAECNPRASVEKVHERRIAPPDQARDRLILLARRRRRRCHADRQLSRHVPSGASATSECANAAQWRMSHLTGSLRTHWYSASKKRSSDPGRRADGLRRQGLQASGYRYGMPTGVEIITGVERRRCLAKQDGRTPGDTPVIPHDQCRISMTTLSL
jgi:hypothetical protein